MAGAVKAELRKFFSTRMWWGMAIGVFLAGALFAVLFALVVAGSTQQGGPGGGALALPDLSDTTMVSTVYTAGLSLAYLLTLVVGVMSIGSEYRHKTITSTFLSTPKRVRVMVAKVTSLLGIGALYGVIFLVGSVGVGGATIAIKGFSPFPEAGPIARALALSLLVLGLWSLLGLGAGILIPNQVAAILIAVGAAWIEPRQLGQGGRPLHAQSGDIGDGGADQHQLDHRAPVVVGRRAGSGGLRRGSGGHRLLPDRPPRRDLTRVAFRQVLITSS